MNTSKPFISFSSSFVPLWQKVNNNIFNINSQLVGINNTSPQDSLDVSGSVIARFYTTSLNVFNPSSDASQNNIAIVPTNGQFHTVLNGRVDVSGATGQIVLGGRVIARTTGSNFNISLGQNATCEGDNNLALGCSSISNGTRVNTLGYGARSELRADRFVIGFDASNQSFGGIDCSGVGTTSFRAGINISNPSSTLDIGGNSIRIRQQFIPLSTADPAGNIGDITWGLDISGNEYIYVKTSVGWKRTSNLSSY